MNIDKAFYGKIVFLRLPSVMKENAINGLQLSYLALISYPTLRRKLTGESALLLNEAIAIRDALAPGYTLEELFC